MKFALDLARNMVGQTGTNPVVGCVIVKEGRIVGIGSHLRKGEAHAEVLALEMAGDQAEGSTVYVTLEPCSHYGRTPPCADRLIEAKVKKVVIATTDPNPLVSGRGIAKLREAGIEVISGVMQKEAEKLNEMFNRFIVSQKPFVTIKTASTLDGKIASKEGDSRWISGEEARQFVHVLRHQHEAIMVGIETVLADDPSLTTRLSVEALHPVRIVVDSRLRLPLTSKLVKDRTAPTWVLTTNDADIDKEKELQRQGVEVIRCGYGKRVDLVLALQMIAEREIGSVLVEGGGKLNGALLEAGLVDKLILFFAPKIIGGQSAPSNFQWDGFAKMSDAFRLTNCEWVQFGDDICLIGYPA